MGFLFGSWRRWLLLIRDVLDKQREVRLNIEASRHASPIHVCQLDSELLAQTLHQFLAELKKMKGCKLFDVTFLALIVSFRVRWSSCALDVVAEARGLYRVRIKQIEVSVQPEPGTISLSLLVGKLAIFQQKVVAGRVK